MLVEQQTSESRRSGRPPRVRVSAPSLRRSFERFRSRIYMIRGATAVCLGGLVFLLVMLLWMWIDLALDLPPTLRLLAWSLAIGLPLFLIVRQMRKIGRESHDSTIADQLDKVGETGGQIRSGFDLAETAKLSPRLKHANLSTGQSDENAMLTEGLASLAIARARRLTAKVQSEDAIPATPLMKSSSILMGTCLFVALLVVIWPRVAWTELTRFFDPFGDHPAYTPYSFVVTPEEPTVRYGESLDLSVEVSGQIADQLELVLIPTANKRNVSADIVEPLDVLPMFSDPSGLWHASIADITSPFEFFIRVRRDRSQTYPVTVITVPEILDVQAQIIPPLYTGLPPYRGRLPVEGVSGLQGTQVRLTALSNRPLSSGTIELTPNDGSDSTVVAMSTASASDEVVGEFDLSHSGKFELEITDLENQSSKEPLSAPIELLEDHHPIVRLSQPKSFSLATPTALLPVVVAAEDDYGIQTCELFRSLNDSPFLPQTLEIPSAMPSRVRVQTILPLVEYDLQPGDEIKLFARAVDNDPHGHEGGIGKGSESAVSVVRIISQQEFERMQQQRAGMKMLMSKYQQAQRRLENVAEKIKEFQEQLESQDPDSPLAEELRQQLKELANAMQQESDSLKKLSESALPLDVDKKLSPQLEEMAELLKELAKQVAQTNENGELTPKELQKQLKKQLEQIQQQQQQHQQETIKPLRGLEHVLPLKQDEGAFVQLVRKQRQLADRLKSLKDFDGGDDPATKARIRELEEQQRRIRDELNDLLDKIEEDIAKLPEDEQFRELRETAENFVVEVRGSGATGEMSSAEEALAQLQGDQGHQSAERAAELLEQFLSQCQNMGNQAGECLPKFSPGLGQSLQNTLEQLTQGMGNQTGGMGTGTAGSGGYSTTSNNLNNIGMYGAVPLLDTSPSMGGMSDETSQQGVIPNVVGVDGAQDAAAFDTSQTNPAYGGAEWGVPLRYRRSAGRYLQQIAEELDE